MAPRIPQITTYLISFIFVALTAGCGGAVESELKARLDLAQSTGDLDEMFVTLTQLTEMEASDPSYKPTLAKVETAIEDRHAMREALAAHDLETALHASNRIYIVFPKNLEAIEAAQKSSRIFSALEQANAALAEFISAYESRKDPKPGADNDGPVQGDGDAATMCSADDIAEFDRTLAESSDRQEAELASLAAARRHAENALALDPEFQRAAELLQQLDDALSARLYAESVMLVLFSGEAIMEASTVLDLTVGWWAYFENEENLDEDLAFQKTLEKLSELETQLPNCIADYDVAEIIASVALFREYGSPSASAYIEAAASYATAIERLIEMMQTPRRDGEAWAEDMIEARAAFDQASADFEASAPIAGVDAMIEILPNLPGQLTIYDEPGTTELVAQFRK